MSSKYDRLPHAERLNTPRQDIADHDSEIEPVPLLHSQHIRTAGAVYDQIPSADRTFDDLVEAGRSVARVVRDTLWFRTLGPGEQITPDALEDSPATNCHGYSIVMSECLEAAGLPHYISYANGHSFVLLLAEDESKQAYMLAGADKKFYSEVSGAISGEAPTRQLADGKPFAHNGFYSQEFIKGTNQVLDDNLAYRHQWLSFRKEGATRFLETEGQINLLDKIQMRTYPAPVGRQVLSSYVELKSLLSLKRVSRAALSEATEAMMALQGLFPDMDQRNGFSLPTSLRGKLLQHQMWDEAEAIAGAFELSRTWEDRSALFLPDTLRKIGRSAGDLARIEQAIDIYVNTSPDNPNRAEIRQKLSAAYSDRSNLNNKDL